MHRAIIPGDIAKVFRETADFSPWANNARENTAIAARGTKVGISLFIRTGTATNGNVTLTNTRALRNAFTPH